MGMISTLLCQLTIAILMICFLGSSLSTAQYSSLTIFEEKWNLLSCQADCNSPTECITELKILHQSNAFMAETIGRFIKIRQTGYLLTICYSKEDVYGKANNWIVRAFQVENATSSCDVSDKDNADDLCLKISSLMRQELDPLSSLNPTVSFTKSESSNTGNVTCSINYPTDSQQLLRIFIRSQDQVEKVWVNAEELRGSFSEDYRFVKLFYTHQIDDYSRYENTSGECVALDEYSSAFKSDKKNLIDTSATLSQKSNNQPKKNGQINTTTQCENIYSGSCKNLPYSTTRFPNTFNHQNQDEAEKNIQQFYSPFLKAECSPDIKLFVCSLYMPWCGETKTLLPCKSLCESVRKGCNPLAAQIDFIWPKKLDCENFSDDILCVNSIKGKN